MTKIALMDNKTLAGMELAGLKSEEFRNLKFVADKFYSTLREAYKGKISTSYFENFESKRPKGVLDGQVIKRYDTIIRAITDKGIDISRESIDELLVSEIPMEKVVDIFEYDCYWLVAGEDKNYENEKRELFYSILKESDYYKKRLNDFKEARDRAFGLTSLLP